MTVQRMLNPIANRIVGSAIHVVGNKSGVVTPKFKVARGIVRRGPKTMVTTKGLLFVSDPLIKGYFVFNDGEPLGFVRSNNDIKKMKIPRKLKRKVLDIAREFGSKSKSKARMGGKHAANKITHPARQFAQRAAIAAAAGGASMAGGVSMGHRMGHKKGYNKGYETALQDVLRYSKSAHSDMTKVMNELQSSGITLIDLKKMSIEEVQEKIKKGMATRVIRSVGDVVEHKYLSTPYKRFKTGVKVGEAGIEAARHEHDKDKKPQVHKVMTVAPVVGNVLAREDLHGGRRKKKKHLHKAEIIPETQGDTLKKSLPTAMARPFMGAPGAPGLGTGLKNAYRKGQLYVRRKMIRPAIQTAKQKIHENKGKMIAGGTFIAGSAALSHSRNKDMGMQQGGY
jgi:hypothetical protein